MFIRSTMCIRDIFYRMVLLTLIVLPVVATADGGENWRFTVSPYLWITGQEGKVATLPPADPAELDVSFSDVMDNLDIALMGLVEARKGRFGLFGEIFYIGISIDADTPGPFYSGGDYEQDLWGISVGGSYALVQNKDQILDAVVGVRFWDLDNELKLGAGAFPASKISEHESWNDPLIGFRGRTRLNEHWYLSGWGVAAVAGDSESAWDVFGGVGYEHSDAFSLTVGYRHQEVDYEKGDFLFDVEMSGPVIGLVFRL
jgi:hypothetical protein